MSRAISAAPRSSARRTLIPERSPPPPEDTITNTSTVSRGMNRPNASRVLIEGFSAKPLAMARVIRWVGVTRTPVRARRVSTASRIGTASTSRRP
jgi:hypothetical protein